MSKILPEMMLRPSAMSKISRSTVRSVPTRRVATQRKKSVPTLRIPVPFAARPFSVCWTLILTAAGMIRLR